MNNPRRPQPRGFPQPGATQDRQALLDAQRQHQQGPAQQQQQGGPPQPQGGPQPTQGVPGSPPASQGAPGGSGPEALKGFLTQAGPMVSRVLGQMGLTKTAAAFAQETSGKPDRPRAKTPKKNQGQTTPAVKAREKKPVSVGKPTVRPKAAKEATRATPASTKKRRV